MREEGGMNKHYCGAALILSLIFLAGCACGMNRVFIKQEMLIAAENRIDPAAKNILVGMTKEQVLEAWGLPDKDHKGISAAYPDLLEYSSYSVNLNAKSAWIYSIRLMDGKVSSIIAQEYGEFRHSCDVIQLQ